MTAPRIRTLALLLLSCAASLAVAEIALRVLTPFPIGEESNKRAHPRLGYVVDSRFPDIDARGFRNPGTRLEEAQIAVVGDSHTFGNNVAAERSFPALLARETGRRVYNFGMPSYGIYQYWVLLRDLAGHSVEEVVLALYPANDLVLHCAVTELPGWRAEAREAGLSPPSCSDRERGEETARRWRHSLRDGAETHSALAGALLAVLPRAVDEPSFTFPHAQHVARSRVEKHARATSLEHEDIQQSFRDSLTIFRDAARRLGAAGIRFSVLIVPSRERVLEAWVRRNGWDAPADFSALVRNENDLTERYEELFTELGVPHLDAIDAVVAAFAEEVEAGRPFYPEHDDAHPFEQGYAAYAEAAHALWMRSRKGPTR